MLKLLEALTRQQKAMIILVLDLGLLPAALFFALMLQNMPSSSLIIVGKMLPLMPYILLGTGGLSYWLGIPRVQLIAYERHAVGLTALVALFAALSAATLSAIFGPELPAGLFVVFGLIYLLIMVAARAFLLQVVLAVYRRARPRARVLIYGAGNTGTQLAQALKAHDGIDPVAFVDDNKSLQGLML